MDDLQEKVDDFIAMGVGAIWVVNPRLRKTMMVQAGGWMPVEELTVPGTAIRMSHAEVFAELNALEGRRSAS
jgi:hypothetical protein